MKNLYKYQGAIWNGSTVYKIITEYIHAQTMTQALRLLGMRVCKDKKIKLWLDAKNLEIVK